MSVACVAERRDRTSGLSSENQGSSSGTSSDKVRKIFVSYKKLLELWNNHPHSLGNKFELGCKKNRKDSPFLRDSIVTRFDGKFLIPYSFKSKNRLAILSMLSAPAGHYAYKMLDNDCRLDLSGRGFFEENTKAAIKMAETLGISYIQGPCCIEGGNCFLFTSNQEQVAILGETSLFLTVLALEEQGYFKELVTDETETLSLDSYRIARNLEKYGEIKEEVDQMNPDTLLDSAQYLGLFRELHEDFSIKQYLDGLMDPVAKEDQPQYFKGAIAIEAKFKQATSVIAKALGVDPKNLIFVPQTEFHIDMEMFVTPDGTLMLHDDEETMKILERIESKTIQQPRIGTFDCTMFVEQNGEYGSMIRKANGEDYTDEEIEYFLSGQSRTKEVKQLSYLRSYRHHAQTRAEKLKDTRKQRIEILNVHNIKFSNLSAVYKAPVKKSCLNYCNGIFLKCGNSDHPSETLFVTTGPFDESNYKVEAYFHDVFIDALKRNLPVYTIETIPTISKTLAEAGGGIHCLTIESQLLDDNFTSAT